MRHRQKSLAALLATVLISTAGCSLYQQEREPYETRRDKTAKGAGYGAAAGVVGALLNGEKEADEILAGAAIGAAVGGGIGFYMDRQEEKLARIPGTTIERLEGSTILVRFDSSVLFDVDSAAVLPGADGMLNEVGSVLLEFPKTAVIVQGHTDSSGGEEHNLDLSERRARAVQTHLLGYGVDRSRTDALGFGESYPIADNTTEQGRQLNRRVELLLKSKGR